MIRRVFSDLPTFKNLTLRPGLNVLLAVVDEGSTDRQTRNRAGKTSLVEVIHFVLGANAGPDSLFRVPELSDRAFGVEFDLGGHPVTVLRRGSDPSKIIVLDGETRHWPISPTSYRPTGEITISNTKWRVVLGELMFGFNQDLLKQEYQKYTPSFRSLISYFGRREGAGGFFSPVLNSKQQVPWDSQVAISFLLGLDWTIPHQLQLVRDREATLKELRSAARQGALGSLISTTAELRTDLTVAEDRVERLRASLSGFQVLPEYHELEREVSEKTRRFHRLASDNTVDRHLLHELQAAMSSEAPPALSNVTDLYEEAGVLLPEQVQTRFEAVREFHNSVLTNRRSYLQGEIEAIHARIADRDREMSALDARRAEIMLVLRTHGALDSYAALQGELTRLEAQTEAIRQRYAAAEQLEGLKTELDIERQNLFRRLQQDYREQRDVLKHAILVFENISKSLYEDAGKLTISESTNGPEFSIRIQGERSKGITNMQIYCFDMMLATLVSERGPGPGFLIHDSHIYDGVDQRQIAHALDTGSRVANERGIQYLVTMNSDAVPAEFPPGFNFEQHVLPVVLTDSQEDGGLFGFRFG
ncbi:MAG TPA: ABC-three component system protein [Longimicrobium sp.]|nr:ABC-three component system protein [Longimicrobium sp.]